MSINYSSSLDKIKFKGRIKTTKRKLEYICSHVCEWIERKAYKNYDVTEFPENFREFKYRYAFILFLPEDKEGAFYIAQGYNGEFKEQRARPEQFVIEYNPNKSGAKIFRDFCDNFLFEITDICYCDIAFDIPGADIKDVLLDTTCDVMTYGKIHNSTYYIAPKEDQSGRVKVYQKDKERERIGEEKEKTLRIEISLKGKYLSSPILNELDSEVLEKCVNRLNSVKIAVPAPELDDWKLFALSKLAPDDFQKCLGMMSFKTRERYKCFSFGTKYDTLGIDIPSFVNEIGKALAPYSRWRKGVKGFDLEAHNRYRQ